MSFQRCLGRRVIRKQAFEIRRQDFQSALAELQQQLKAQCYA